MQKVVFGFSEENSTTKSLAIIKEEKHIKTRYQTKL